MESRHLGTLKSPTFTSQCWDERHGRLCMAFLFGGQWFWGVWFCSLRYIIKTHLELARIQTRNPPASAPQVLITGVNHHIWKNTLNFLWFAQSRGESTLSLWTRQESRIRPWRSNARDISVLVCRMEMQTLSASNVVPYHRASS